MKNTSIREKLLKTELKQYLEKNHSYIDFSKYHHHTINGFYSSLTSMIIHGKRNPRKDKDDKLQGYHIHSKSIHNFKRNKVAKDIGIYSLVHKASGSTYHANNSRGKSNGYSHWYLFDESVNNANYMADIRFKKMIEHDEKYKHTNEKYKDTMRRILSVGGKPRDKNIIEYIKIDKRLFIGEYSLFIKGLSEQFSIVLNRVFYWDKNFVYVDNSSFRKLDNESLDGYGRSYSLVGSLNKELRKRLLKGHIELDISTTAQVIFMNLYYMDTIKGGINTDLKQWRDDFPEHYKLVTDKVGFRREIASLFNVDTPTAKKIITHLTYSPNANILHEYANDKAPSEKAKIKVGLKLFLREAKKLRKSVLEKFYYHELDYNHELKISNLIQKGIKNIIPPVKEYSVATKAELKKILRENTKEAKKWIKENPKKFYNHELDYNQHLKIGNLKLKDFRGLIDEEIRINNLGLKGKGRGKKLDDRIAFRITELVEHQIREKMITVLEYYSKGECIYQIHDALIIKELPKELSTDMIRGYVKKELGFTIAISKDEL